MMETLEAMSPGTKRQVEMYTPNRRKVFFKVILIVHIIKQHCNATN